jgi:hypothetical protein
MVAGVHGTQSTEYKTGGLQEIDYLLSRFVATGPVSLAWEKVKFSFVVDWFVGLSGVIDKMDNALTGGSKKLKYAWVSEGHHTLVAAIKQTFEETTYPVLDNQQIALYDIRKYHRSPAVVDYTPTLSGRFGKKQASLSVALIHQMAANLSRKR